MSERYEINELSMDSFRTHPLAYAILDTTRPVIGNGAALLPDGRPAIFPHTVDGLAQARGAVALLRLAHRKAAP